MRKYLFILKTSLMESLQYVTNTVLSFVTFFIVLFVFVNLWQYIYSDPGQLINGYSLDQMLWYVIITETIWFGTRNTALNHQISQDIKSGGIAYTINKPYHYLLYLVFRYLGETILKLTLYFTAGIIIGYRFIGSLPNFTIFWLLPIIPVFLAGMLINLFLQMCISVLSFWIEDAEPFHWIYTKIILVLGILFPVEMFPAWAQPIIKCTPIYVFTYGPARLIIHFDLPLFLQVILAQGIYLVISVLLLVGLYQRGVKRVNVNGG